MKEKNMYFDNEYVTGLIIKYQENRNTGKERDRDLENEIASNLMLIVNAVINKYSLWRFDELENLQAEAIAECWKYIPNFDTSKGMCFNLFSLICKYHLIGMTVKDKKNRQNADVDIHPEVEASYGFDYSAFLTDLEKFFIEKINKHFPEKKEKYLELTAILMEHLDHNGGQVTNKSELLGAFRSYGYRQSEYKSFIKDMEQFKEELYEFSR